MFSNTPNGAESSSILFSLVETAKANNLNPYQYIKYLLEKLPTARTSELESFLPWSETLPETCRTQAKISNRKSEVPVYKSKGVLQKALVKLRNKFMARYQNKESC